MLLKAFTTGMSGRWRCSSLLVVTALTGELADDVVAIGVVVYSVHNDLACELGD
jgi:hypothetical protein